MKSSLLILRPLTAAFTLAMFSQGAYAISLGEPLVLSRLGEPLRLTIPIMDSAAEELAAVRIHVASAAGYAQSHTKMQPWMQRATISIEWRKGKPFVNISAEAQDDAIVDMVFEIQWPAGRMLQGVSVLLDPPAGGVMTPLGSATPSSPAPITKVQPEAAVVVPVSKIPRAVQAVPAENAASTPKTSVQEDVDEPKGRILTVKRGDTLMSLSRPLASNGVSVEQVMMGLFQNNAHAFIGGNMNRILADSRLKAPTIKQLKTSTPGSAHVSVRRSLGDFSVHRTRVTDIVAEKDSALPQKEGHSGMGKIIMKVDAAKDMPVIDKLTLSASGSTKRISTGADSKDTAGGHAQEEDIIAARRALANEKARSTELEANLKEMQALLQLKSQMLDASLHSKSSAAPGVSTKQPILNPVSVNAHAAVIKPEPAKFATGTLTGGLAALLSGLALVGIGIRRSARKRKHVDSKDAYSWMTSPSWPLDLGAIPSTPAIILDSPRVTPVLDSIEAADSLLLAKAAIESGAFSRAEALLSTVMQLGDKTQFLAAVNLEVELMVARKNAEGRL
jgi:pilus assembly protein FimV